MVRFAQSKYTADILTVLTLLISNILFSVLVSYVFLRQNFPMLYTKEDTLPVAFEDHRIIVFFLISALQLSIYLALKRYLFLALLIIVFGVFTSYYSQPLLTWLGALGIDSFSEVFSFSWNEFIFFRSTAQDLLTPTYPKETFFILLISGVIYFFVIAYIKKILNLLNSRQIFTSGLVSLISASCILFGSTFTLFLKSSMAFLETKKNFHTSDYIPTIQPSNPLRIYIYTLGNQRALLT